MIYNKNSMAIHNIVQSIYQYNTEGEYTMEIIPIKNVMWKLVCKRYPHSFPETKYYKRRPVRTSDQQLYRIYNAYQLKLTQEDIDQLTKDPEINLSAAYLDRSEVIEYFINTDEGKEYFKINGVANVDIKEIENSHLYITDSHKELFDDTIVFYTASEEITTLSKADLNSIKKKETIEINKKLTKTFALNSIKDVLAKYKMKIYANEEVCFIDNDAVKAFVLDALEKTIVKDLNDLNLEVKLSKRFRKFNSKSTIFKLSDIKIK